MQYIIKRGNRYYYQRRIPTPVLEFTDSTYLKISLKTDSKELAKRRCARLNAEVESYWKGLIDQEQPRDHQHFKENINLAKIIGFNYQPIEQVGNLPSQELIERLQFAKEHQSMDNVVDTLLGTVKRPEITISRALDIFWPITKDRLIGKSGEQIRRWRNPRLKAVRNFTKVCGDLSIEAVGRNEIVKFKDWWLFRIEEEGVKASTANKDITHIKGILETVSDHLQLDLDIHKIFRKPLSDRCPKTGCALL